MKQWDCLPITEKNGLHTISNPQTLAIIVDLIYTAIYH
jgi:hypothetical protein